jgi:hypothetical protein
MMDFARDWEPTPIGLYAWEAPRPEETAQGLLLRLAEMHGHASTDRTAACIAVSRSRMAHGDTGQIEKFATAIRQDPAALKADSALRDADGRLMLRGHDLTDFINFGLRRLCPGCVAESRHQRFWWDIRSIASCPRHGLKLVDRCDCATDVRLGWRSGGILHCSRCGRRDQRLPSVPADPMVVRTDAYLLSRLGAGKAEPLPVLDALRLKDVFLTLERVGAASQGGYSKEWQSAASLGLPLETVQALGFQILADGGLEGVLTRIYDGFIAAGGRPEQGFSSCYGWFYQWFNHKRGIKFSPILAEAFLHHGAARFPIVPKSGLGTLSGPKRKKLSLKEAASICGASVSAMRNFGSALGVVRTKKLSGSQISFPADLVAKIAADLKNAYSLGDAAKRLGVGTKIVHQLIATGILVRALQGSRLYRNIYLLEKDKIDGLLEKLAAGASRVDRPSRGLDPISALGRGQATTIVGCIRLILDGRATVAERLKGAPGLQALYLDYQHLAEVAGRAYGEKEIGFDAAVRRMRLNRRGMSRAIKLGLLPGVKPDAKTIPEKVVGAFCAKYIMLAEICEHIDGWYPDVKDTMERMGFPADPQLAKCLHAGYPRKEVEVFLAKVAAGKISLAAEPSAFERLAIAVRKWLKDAELPVPTDELLARLRKEGTVGPSDKVHFFHSAMWNNRKEFVFVTGAGWWLRKRPYHGRTWPVEADASHHDIVDHAVVGLLRAATAPMSPDAIIAALDRKGVQIVAADKVVYLRYLALRRRDDIAKLTGLGYWERARPYPPAVYDPKSCPSGIQTAVQRAGLWTIKLLNELGRPLTRAELEPLLRERGIIPSKSSRAYVGNGVSEFADDIVYLNGVGYWLKKRPWPAAGYCPSIQKSAA